MTPNTANTPQVSKPDYGVDAPSVMRNLFLFGGCSLLLAIFLPHTFHLGPVVIASQSFYWPAGFLLAQGFLYLLYVKVGKHYHRDRMLAIIPWRGDEQVLDVGCGRGLLLAGAAKHIQTGHATGIDLWSQVDMGGNSPEATLHNLALEGVAERCSVLSLPAQDMVFPDAHFDVILSNLCIHNIYDRATRRAALHQIVRVLKPGGIALISDYKLTGEYAAELIDCGLQVEKRRGTLLQAFPQITIVVARKPL